MWTIQNVSPDTVSTTDTPIPLTWAPGQRLSVPIRYATGSAQIQAAIFAQQLAVLNYGSVAPSEGWAPVTYVLLGTQTLDGLTPATLTQSGETGPLTLGLWTRGTLLVNLTALTSGASLAVNFQAWDGAVWYPALPVIAAASSVGPLAVTAWDPPAPLGRFVWMITGQVSATAVYQLGGG